MADDAEAREPLLGAGGRSLSLDQPETNSGEGSGGDEEVSEGRQRTTSSGRTLMIGPLADLAQAQPFPEAGQAYGSVRCVRHRGVCVIARLPTHFEKLELATRTLSRWKTWPGPAILETSWAVDFTLERVAGATLQGQVVLADADGSHTVSLEAGCLAQHLAFDEADHLWVSGFCSESPQYRIWKHSLTRQTTEQVVTEDLAWLAEPLPTADGSKVAFNRLNLVGELRLLTPAP